MMKILTDSLKYGLVIEDNSFSDNYGCIIKIVTLDKEIKK